MLKPWDIAVVQRADHPGLGAGAECSRESRDIEATLGIGGSGQARCISVRLGSGYSGVCDSGREERQNDGKKLHCDGLWIGMYVSEIGR